jgi:hypothetical protein
LTSLFIDSIHQSVATNDRCIQVHEKWKGRIDQMATKKKAKKAAKKKH